MDNKEYAEIKKDYQEMKSKYTSDEILESIFIAIRVIDKNVGFNITNELNIALEAIVNLYERIEKLESKIKQLEMKRGENNVWIRHERTFKEPSRRN